MRPPHNGVERDLLREVVSSRHRGLLEDRFEQGGTPEAVLRALIYIHVPEGGVDERAFVMLRELRATLPAGRLRSMAQLKTMFRDQSLLVWLDEERAAGSLPALLPEDADERKAALDALHAMIAVRGSLPEECKRRLKRVEALFAAKPDKPAKSGAPHARCQQPSRQRPHA